MNVTTHAAKSQRSAAKLNLPRKRTKFAPSAEPIHPQIDRRVVSWLETFGRGNAEEFDKLGWIYFKGENYDLFYPGYGDSYPSLRGAIGMT